MTTRPFDEDRPPIDGPRRRRSGGPGGGKRGGRRGDPNATVPEAEFTSYYGHNIVKPPPWEWPIPAYLFLGGLAAGSGLVAAGAHATGKPRLRSRSRITALAAVAAGGAALAADLGRPERALNMMRTVKLTSPMSVGSWILSGFGAFTGAAIGLELVRPRLQPGSGLARAAGVADGLASAGSAFFAPPLAAYTAVLLSDTAAPTWHESYRELPFVFVSSALAAGTGMSMITSPVSETNGAVRQLAVAGAVCELGVGELMKRRLGELAEPLEQPPAKRWHKTATVLTAAGAIGAAVFGGTRIGAALSGAALVGGSLATRFGIFHAGMTSAKDPRYTVRPQRARAAAAAEQGRGITQPGGEWPT
ncbi:polysulfide reductase NrfD [Propionibacteriaceae bacterium ES.041]|nr:polysulfide reductase NrfD [Propionibacteriaceae bacterium ES.041]